MTPIPAATVVLVRPPLEVFLVRRHRKASFMSDAFVFPGGRIDPDDGGPEVAAVRELFEEAGVLLTDRPLAEETQAEWRRRLNAGSVGFRELLDAERLQPDRSRLHFWSRWITPSFEPKRFDAAFFVAELPPGQTPSFDQKETVEELWISPAEALARQTAGTLRLPPPQVRTFIELEACGTIERAVAVAAERQKTPAVLCPRPIAGEKLTLLLPWDPDYARAEGEGTPLAPDHPWASPPSRLVWDGGAWRPGSPVST